MKTDVVIVGAGPAGIFTAIEVLRKDSKKKICHRREGEVGGKSSLSESQDAKML